MRTLLYFLFFIGLIFSCKKKVDVEEKKEETTQLSFNEVYRPQFHFSSPRYWHNDPNGLMYYDGEYHMFYQYNPKGNDWGYMHWGHAVSEDLLLWQILPIAIYPDSASTDIRKCTAWSGSGVVDWKNTLGKQEGDIHTLIVFYTSQQCGQRMAYSMDKGRSWNKYEGNPIIPLSVDEARDPFVRWHEPSQQYIMGLFRKPDNDKNKQGNSIYTSNNLIDWRLTSHTVGFYEVPGLFELTLEEPNEKKWIMSGGNGDYMIGSFDGNAFTPETEMITGDYGKNYWAPQTYFGIPESDGRTVQIAWLRDGKYPDMPFNQQMTFPVELSLKKFGDELLLSKNPVREISSLYLKSHIFNEQIIDENTDILDNLNGDLFHIKIQFSNINADKLILNVRRGNSNGNRIAFDLETSSLKFDGQVGILKSINGIYDAEILVDRASVEIFANSGTMVMTNNFTPKPDFQGLKIKTIVGTVKLCSLEVHELKSIYK